MGLLDSIMRGLNIGGCKVGISTDRQEYPQGSTINGNIILTGGKIAQSPKAMRVELEEFWTEHRSSGKSSRRVTVYRTREMVVFNGFSIEPDEETSFDFSMNLPLNSRLSTSSTGWNLKATIDIPNAIDPGLKTRLNIIPAAEFQAIAEACGDLQFTLKPNSWKWNKGTEMTYFRLLPSDEMKADFDYLAFNLLQSGATGGVSGKIIFNLQEKSFMDYLKAIIMMDKVEKTIVLKKDDIFLEDGAINRERIVSAIEPMINQIRNARNEFNSRTPGETVLVDTPVSSTSKTPLKIEISRKDSDTPTTDKQKSAPKEFDPKRIDDYI